MQVKGAARPNQTHCQPLREGGVDVGGAVTGLVPAPEGYDTRRAFCRHRHDTLVIGVEHGQALGWKRLDQRLLFGRDGVGAPKDRSVFVRNHCDDRDIRLEQRCNRCHTAFAAGGNFHHGIIRIAGKAAKSLDDRLESVAFGLFVHRTVSLENVCQKFGRRRFGGAASYTDHRGSCSPAADSRQGNRRLFLEEAGGCSQFSVPAAAEPASRSNGKRFHQNGPPGRIAGSAILCTSEPACNGIAGPRLVEGGIQGFGSAFR